MIGIASYSYVLENNKLKQDKIADLDLAQADQLVVGEPLWSDVDLQRWMTREWLPSMLL